MIATHNVKVNGRWFAAGEEYNVKSPAKPESKKEPTEAETPKEEPKQKTPARKRKISG